ncbi:MAG TPA: hypothetical protein VHR66_04890 [Gemmataceae bacterium]|jgi:hypothetical protein|nr:hypothetical protein [Gemmataceae bacterium]
MKRVASLIVLGLCALPGLASVPSITGKTKPSPRLTPPQQLPAQPAMQIPPTIQRPLLNLNVVEALEQLAVDLMLRRFTLTVE